MRTFTSIWVHWFLLLSTVVLHKSTHAAEPVVIITSPAANDQFTVGTPLTLHATAKDPTTGAALMSSAFSWQINVIGAFGQSVPFLSPTTGNNIETDPIPGPTDYYSMLDGYLQIQLTVTNGADTTVVTQNVDPVRYNITLHTDPEGLFVRVMSYIVYDPAVVSCWSGMPLPLHAPNQGAYIFQEWSNGGDQEQTVLVTGKATYTAVFDNPGDDSNPTASPTAMASTGGPPPLIKMQQPHEGDTFFVGEVITLRGSAISTVTNQTISRRDLTWEVRYYTSRTEEIYTLFLPPTKGSRIILDPAPEPINVLTLETSYLQIRLSAVDDATGGTTTIVRNIEPSTIQISLHTKPKNADLFFYVMGADFPIYSPVNLMAWENQTMEIEAPDQYPYLFDSWSNDTTAASNLQTIQISSNMTQRTFTATFIVASTTPTMSPVPSFVPTPSQSSSISPVPTQSAIPTVDFMLSDIPSAFDTVVDNNETGNADDDWLIFQDDSTGDDNYTDDAYGRRRLLDRYHRQIPAESSAAVSRSIMDRMMMMMMMMASSSFILLFTCC